MKYLACEKVMKQLKNIVYECKYFLTPQYSTNPTDNYNTVVGGFINTIKTFYLSFHC